MRAQLHSTSGGSVSVLPTFAQEPAPFFKQNCMSCHTVGGGRLAGPDLKDVTQRRGKAWLVQWIQDPRPVLDSGDP